MPRIGPYTLHEIHAGYFALDGGAMFGIVPRPLWERHTKPDARNRIPLSTRCLLLESSDRLVLIDNGIGDKENAKFADIYALDYGRTDLHRALQAAGFSASDVTDVILTHLHFDHCGGTTHRNGNRLELTFPNARHYVQHAHWEWAATPNLRERASFLSDNLQPIGESDQLYLVEGEQEILPGVSVLTVNGHTEAQQLVKVAGPEGSLVFVADLLPTTAHVRPVWTMAYDIRPLISISEKESFLQRAAQQGWTLFFEHDPVTSIASVTETDQGYQLRDERPLSDL